MIGIPPGVQYLHRNFPILSMHCFGYSSMFPGLTLSRQLSGEGLHPTRTVGRIAAGNNQSDAAACALREIDRQPLVLVAIFEPRVHGSHEHSIL